MSRMYKAEVVYVPGNPHRLDFTPFKATYTWLEKDDKHVDAATVLAHLKKVSVGTGITPIDVGYIVNVA